MRRFFALALALILALGLAGCGADGENGPENGYRPDDPDPEYPLFVGDALIEFRPTRVVSLAPSLTEKIYDLGHGGRLVGISDHQGDFPPSLAHLPAYGLAIDPDIPGILELNPHVVFSVDELPQSAMFALEAAGVPLVVLPSYAHSMGELGEIYIGLSMALDGRTTGRMMGERFMRDFNRRIEEIAARVPTTDPPLHVVYLRGLDLVATGDTLEGWILERMGFLNIAAGQRDWAFDPGLATIPVSELDVIFFDPGYVDPDAWGSHWQGAGATRVIVDSLVFDRQSLRLLGQLEILSQAKLDLQDFGDTGDAGEAEG